MFRVLQLSQDAWPCAFDAWPTSIYNNRGEICFLGYFIYKFCTIHLKYNFPRFCSCRSMHVHSCQLLLMRACAWRPYCKKCGVNLGSKSSDWPYVPVLITYIKYRRELWGRVVLENNSETTYTYHKLEYFRCT